MRAVMQCSSGFSGNKVGETGVEAFLIAIQRQAELSAGSSKPPGLLRLSLTVRPLAGNEPGKAFPVKQNITADL